MQRVDGHTSTHTHTNTHIHVNHVSQVTWKHPPPSQEEGGGVGGTAPHQATWETRQQKGPVDATHRSPSCSLGLTSNPTSPLLHTHSHTSTCLSPPTILSPSGPHQCKRAAEEQYKQDSISLRQG